MSRISIVNILQIFANEVVRLLNPEFLAQLGRALASVILWFNSKKDNRQAARAWNVIFKDERWLQAVSSLTYENLPSPSPALVGSDLESLYYGVSSAPIYLALLISDWGGDAIHMKQQLFASLREQDYEFDKDSSEIRFKRTGIILHIGDAIKNEQWIEMRDPSRLFRRRKHQLHTAALYYNDNSLYQIGPEEIGGIRGPSTRKKNHVRYICSIRLRWRNGDHVYRVIRRRNLPMRLVSERTEDDRNRKWVTSWRVAGAHEVVSIM